MISVDYSFILQIVNFLFLIWILNMVLYKPIRNIIGKRKEKVDGLEQSIETFAKGAKEKDEAFLSGVKEARLKGMHEKDLLLAAGADEEKRIIQKINQKARDEIGALRDKIAKDAENIRQSLENEVDSFADIIARKILGRAV
jgi:F-type H+-transporting ATPase subunit b